MTHVFLTLIECRAYTVYMSGFGLSTLHVHVTDPSPTADRSQLATPASASVHQTIPVPIARAPKPAQAHELKLSVAGGWWKVGTTLSLQHDTGRDKRGMVL